MIRFGGELQEAEFRRAQWMSTPWFLRWFGWLLLGLLVVMTATGGWRAVMADPASQLPRVLVVLLLATVAIVAPRLAIRKVWERTPLLREPVSGEIAESGVVWNTPSSQTTLRWDQIVKRQTSADLILLYTGPRQALLLPKRYFASEEDWRGASALITTAGG